MFASKKGFFTGEKTMTWLCKLRFHRPSPAMGGCALSWCPFSLWELTATLFSDVSYYEQQLKNINSEIQAAERRKDSMRKATKENLSQMHSVHLELLKTKNIVDECYSKVKKARNDGKENIQELEQELEGHRGKETQLAQKLEQTFDVASKLSDKDLDVLPLLTELEQKKAETRNLLTVSRQLEEQEQFSFHATISGV